MGDSHHRCAQYCHFNIDKKSEAGFQHLTESVKNYGSSQDKKGSNPARVVYIFIPGFA